MRNAHKQREKKREYARELKNRFKPFFICVNCGTSTQWGHYCPPALGDSGFYICDDPNYLEPAYVNLG